MPPAAAPTRTVARRIRDITGLGLALLATTAAEPPAPTELGRPMVREYPPGANRIGHHTSALVQDGDGFVYSSSLNAVRVYDGTTWRPVLLPDRAAGVRRFAVTDSGIVFASGPDALGWFRRTGQTAEFVSLIDHLPPDARNVEEIGDVLAVGDTVWFADGQKILVWEQDRFAVIPLPSPTRFGSTRLHRVGETVAATTLGQPLYRVDQGTAEVWIDDPLFRENRIVLVEPGDDGAWLVLTAERGWWRVAPDRASALWPLEANRWLTGKRVTDARRLRDGGLAVIFSPTTGSGGMRFDAAGRYLGPINTTSGLYNEDLRSMGTDRDGGLWLGCVAGIFRLEWPSAFTIFDAYNGLSQGPVTDIVRHRGALFAATPAGVFRLDPLSADGRAARFERLDAEPATSLVSHAGGLLAIGDAAVRVDSGHGFEIVAKLPAAGQMARPSRVDPARVWIATAQGVQAIRHTATGWIDEGRLPGPSADCADLAEQADGSLWVVMRRELWRLAFADPAAPFAHPPRRERLEVRPGSPDLPATTRLAFRDGQPVVLIPGWPTAFAVDAADGAFRPTLVDHGSMENQSTEAWFAAGPADRADAGAAGTLFWLGRADNVFALPAAGGGPTRRLPNLPAAGIGSVTHLFAESTPGGPVLWVGGTNGLLRVDIDRAFAARPPFRTLLTDATVRDGTELPPDPGPVRFEFVALRFNVRDGVTYQTRLLGQEPAWSPWSAARQSEYLELPAGDYRFEVRARDADGEKTAITAVSFRVRSPWWLTSVAWATYTVAGLGGLFAAERWRTRSLRGRATRLETIVAERTAELARQNTELVRLHQLEFDEKIAARLAEERARLEVLRYQLNPHFLFNTLASISAALSPEASTARAMLERLAEFCRLTLYRSDEQDWTTLGGELSLLRTYLEIERSRWGDLLDAEIDCDPALADERLPHFLLLPLLENALKYGRATSPDRVGIRLAARRDAEGALLLEVSNTGLWIEPTTRKSVSSLGIGLHNLRERLARHFPRAHRLEISSAEGLVTVTLRIFRAPVL